MKVWRKYFIGCCLSLGLFLAAEAQNKTDKVHLKNGDIITGEIKNMNLAILSFDMTGPGIISIKWEEVKEIYSKKPYIIQLRNGTILTDSLDSNIFKKYRIMLNDIIDIEKSKSSFFKRLYGTISLGVNYTKSSAYVQTNSAISISYRIPKWEFNLSTNFINSNTYRDSAISKQEAISFSTLLFLPRKNFAFSQIAWQKNTELGVQNRFLYNGGVGKLLITDNHNRLSAGLGISTNIEQSIDNVTYTGNFDGLGFIAYKMFYNSSPKKMLEADYFIYPSLIQSRVRMQFDLSTSIEAFKDFYIGLTAYYVYDSKPLEGAASTNDYGFNFTLNYKFGY